MLKLLQRLGVFGSILFLPTISQAFGIACEGFECTLFILFVYLHYAINLLIVYGWVLVFAVAFLLKGNKRKTAVIFGTVLLVIGGITLIADFLGVRGRDKHTAEEALALGFEPFYPAQLPERTEASYYIFRDEDGPNLRIELWTKAKDASTNTLIGTIFQKQAPGRTSPLYSSLLCATGEYRPYPALVYEEDCLEMVTLENGIKICPLEHSFLKDAYCLANTSTSAYFDFSGNGDEREGIDVPTLLESFKIAEYPSQLMPSAKSRFLDILEDRLIP